MILLIKWSIGDHANQVSKLLLVKAPTLKNGKVEKKSIAPKWWCHGDWAWFDGDGCWTGIKV